MRARLFLAVVLLLVSCEQSWGPLNSPLDKNVTVELGVSPSAQTLLVNGPSATLRATVNPSGQAVSWTSSDPSVATVGPDTGVLTAVAPGTSVVTATMVRGGKAVAAPVTVLGWIPATLSGIVTHYAGAPVGQGSSDGTGANALFNQPSGVCVAGGNLYVADQANNTIRKVVPATGVVSTFAGAAGVGSTSGEVNATGTAARFLGPWGICSDGTNLYVTDTGAYTVRKIVLATGVVSTLAGQLGSSGSTDGSGSSARFYNPQGICTDGANLYVADTGNQTIRKIVVATGAVTTLAGQAGFSGSNDGVGTLALFSRPTGIATDGTNLYLTDANNNTIRKIVLGTGAVSTIVGSATSNGIQDGVGTAAVLQSPCALCFDGTDLWFSDQGGGNCLRRVTLATLAVTTIAGSLSAGTADGPALSARFTTIGGIAAAGGTSYMVDRNSNTIRVLSSGTVSTLAGTASMGSVDGLGTAARFYSPSSVCSDGTNLYVTDSFNNVIRRVVLATGMVSTVVGSVLSSGAADGTGTQAQLSNPWAICTDRIHLYVIDSSGTSLRKVNLATWAVTTVTDLNLNRNGNVAQGLCTDGVYLYITLDSGSGVAALGSILKVRIDTGTATSLAIGLTNPRGICTTGRVLYVAEGSAYKVRKVDPTSGVSAVLAGSGTFSWTDGTGTLAAFDYPIGVHTDGTNLYVSDYYGGIRQIVLSTAVVTTLAGAPGPGSGNADGTGNAPTFSRPRDLCLAGGSLYVADEGNNCLRKVQ